LNREGGRAETEEEKRVHRKDGRGKKRIELGGRR
jgi:hypothetical protein